MMRSKIESISLCLSRIEVLGWSGHSEQSVQDARQFLIQHLDEYPLTEVIVHRCTSLRRQYSLKLPDAIIAATALHLQLPLVTRNTDDFKNIEDLSLINPFDLPTENTNSEETSNT